MELKIQKTDKIIIIFYIFLAISFTIGIFYIASTFDTIEHTITFPQPVTELQITKIVDVNQEKAFLIMTDVKNYPKILPKNIVSVNIINRVDNTVLAEYELIEHGIRTKLLAEHTMYPYDKHILEIMDGDAKGTKLIQDFTTVNTEKQKWCDESFGECLVWVECECTQITSRMEHKITDVSTESVSGGKSNASAIIMLSNIITSFDEYMDASENETKKIIDDLYREILLRPADTEAFEYWGSLLENENITKLELRKSILKSQEAIDLKRFDSTSGLIKSIFNEILNRDPTVSESSHYKYLVDIEEITEEQIRLELEELKNFDS